MSLKYGEDFVCRRVVNASNKDEQFYVPLGNKDGKPFCINGNNPGDGCDWGHKTSAACINNYKNSTTGVPFFQSTCEAATEGWPKEACSIKKLLYNEDFICKQISQNFVPVGNKDKKPFCINGNNEGDGCDWSHLTETECKTQYTNYKIGIPFYQSTCEEATEGWPKAGCDYVKPTSTPAATTASVTTAPSTITTTAPSTVTTSPSTVTTAPSTVTTVPPNNNQIYYGIGGFVLLLIIIGISIVVYNKS